MNQYGVAMSVDFETAYRLMLSELLPPLLHEFNNPLTAIGAIPELLRSSKQEMQPGDEELLTSLRVSIDTMHKLFMATRRLLQADLTSRYIQIQPFLESLLLIMGPSFRRSRLSPVLKLDPPVPSIELSGRHLVFYLYSALEVCLQLGRQADIQMYSPCELVIKGDTESGRVMLDFQASSELPDGLPKSIRRKLDGARLSIDMNMWGDRPILKQLLSAEQDLEASLKLQSEWKVLPEGLRLRLMFP